LFCDLLALDYGVPGLLGVLLIRCHMVNSRLVKDTGKRHLPPESLGQDSPIGACEDADIWGLSSAVAELLLIDVPQVT
jgi:hypothetical protein